MSVKHQLEQRKVRFRFEERAGARHTCRRAGVALCILCAVLVKVAGVRVYLR